MAQSMSAREAHSLRIRASLIEACGDLLAEQAIDAITINNIVKAAGVAKGSFYNHFADKEALAAAVSTSIREEIAALVRKGNENITDPAYKVVRGVCYYLQLAVADPRRAIILLHGHESVSTTDRHPNQMVQEHVVEGVNSGRFISQCEQAGLISVLGVVYITGSRILEEKLSAKEARELSINVLTLMLCGFGLDKSEAHRIVSGSAMDIIVG